MVKIFRKIRQNLLLEGRTVNYLKYAIGEIVLVVIGILIALQINLWNEGRKENNLKNTYVSRLISDIRQDTIDIRAKREWLEEAQKIIENTMHVLNNETFTDKNMQVIESYFDKGWSTRIPLFNENTYKDLSQTGNMSILKSTEIRNNIIQYYSHIEEARNEYKGNEEWVLPIDVKVTEMTSAMEFAPVTKALFEVKDKRLAADNILTNKKLLERSAASHYWINHSVLMDLTSIENEAQKLLLSLNSELIIK